MIFCSFKIGTSEQYGLVARYGIKDGNTSFSILLYSHGPYTDDFFEKILLEVGGMESVDPRGINPDLDGNPFMFTLTVKTSSLPRSSRKREVLAHIAQEIEKQFVAAKERLKRMEAAASRFDEERRYILFT